MEHLKRALSVICKSNSQEGRIGSIDYNIWLAQLTGVPLLGFKKESQCYRGFIILYGLFMTLIIAVVYTAFELYDLAVSFDDFDAVTQNLCLTLSHIAGILKAANLHYCGGDLRKAINKLKFVSQKYIVTAKQRESFYRGELDNKIFLTHYATLVGITGFTATLLLFFNTPATVGYKFPYRIKFPEWLPYSAQLAFMGISLPMTALQIVTIDYLNVNMINQIRFQLNFLNLAFDELIIPASSEDLELVKVNVVKTRQQLHSIVSHHCCLIDLQNDIEKIFRLPILMQFLASLVIFGLTGFRATVNRDASNTDAVLYLYCGCLFSQLFIYCWFGNDVFEQSKTLTNNGYQSTWYQFDPQVKKALNIFLTGSQRPIVFTAGGFMALSLPSFTNILGKSYSVLAVLRQLYGD